MQGDIAAARTALEALGMRVEALSKRRPERMVEGWLAPGAADEVAKLAAVRAVIAVMGSGSDSGSALSEGDAAHNGPAARALGPTGAGVTVVVAQAVDDAKAAGTAYLASAGNRARQGWEGTFTPGTSGFHNFNPGGAEDQVQGVVVVPNNGSLSVTLQWAEPWGGAVTDLDLGIYDFTAAGFVGSVGTTNNLVTGLPVETASATNTSGVARTYGVAIQRTAGAGTPFMKYIARNNFGTFSIGEHNTNSPTINPDAASANGALAIAAVQWNDSGLNTAEVFSSRGPTTRLFDAAGNPLPAPDVRAKPDLAAADGVQTTVPSSGLNPFFGTSAATPSAAGIAVLLRQANPAMSVNELYAIMSNPANANDCTSAAGVPDTDCGAGFVFADKAVAQALDGTPPGVTPSLGSAAGQANGWFHGDVSVSWNVSDGESPVGDSSGCGPSIVNTDGSFVFTCQATSAGGTTTQTVGVNRDASPPSAPAITGIAAKTYAACKLPKSSAIGCSASDPTSGLARCVVTGFDSGAGSHTLTATATNGAGLTSTSSLTYRVTSALKLELRRHISLHRLLASGLPLRVVVPSKGTKLAVKLTASGVTASAARRTVVGKLRKTARKKGTIRLRVKLNRRGRRLLAEAAKARLRVTVSSRSKTAGRASASRTVKVKR